MFKNKDKSKPLLMAAMYSDNEEIFVLTRNSFGHYAEVHDRMPVLLEDDEIDLWINCDKYHFLINLPILKKKNSLFLDIIDKKILNQ